MMLLTINYILALTAGDIAILAVNTDATKNMAFVALTDIPANTSISFSDNAWNATTPAWRTGEGTIKWNHTSAVSKGTVITLTFGSPFTASLGTVTSTGSFNLSADGDQVLVYEGTTAPSTNDASNWLWGFSTENFAWGNNSNTSDIPTALSGYSAAMTTSTTETDNAYFANSSTAQSSVSVSGTKSELITLFTNRDKYYKNNTGPLTIPTYTITISSSVTAPTTQASNITFSSVESTQMIVSWTNGNGAKRIVKMNTSNSFTNPGDGTDPTADDSWNNSGEQVIYNGSGNSVTVTNLSASTTYWFRVYEYNGSGTSTKYLNTTATNNPNNQITSTPPPNAPTATDATSVSYNKFTANWNSVSGATKYYLDVYTKGANATDLIISEYVEGSSNNKYLEIYNGTNNSIDLSGYKLQLYTNGSSTASTDNQLSGTLNSGQCIVYKNSSAALTLPYGVTATTNSAVNFNGDDAVAIYKTSTKSYVDIFGRIGEDPGTAWTIGGYTTENKTLVRKASVTSGITSNPTLGFPTLDTEWDMYNQDTASYLGSHTMNSGNLYVSGYQNKDVGNVTSYEVSGLEGDKTYYYVVRAYNEYGTSANSNEISVTTTSAPPPPTITVSTTELTGFGYVESSGPSSEKTFTISGSNLTANISIDAPTNYEISEDSGGSFSAEDPLVLTPSVGSVSETTIYVRLKAGLSAGNYNNENITASSTGATDKTVTCSGTVYKPEPSNHCSNFIVASVTSSTIKLTWTDAAKTAPDGYLIKGSSVSFADISAPVDGTPESNSTLVRNVNQSVGNWTFVNLSDNTTYYFRIYPYTNNGTNINYKTDGEIPQASGTTLESQNLSAGDIAVIGYRCDDPDKFAILLLTSISAGTDVKITDNGFNDLSALATNEGTITWTVPAGGLSRGTVVTFTYDSSWTVDIGSIFISSSIQLAVSGDQLIVYQGESSSPTFIYALSTTPWVTTGTITSNTSYCPTGLENGTNCLSFTSEKDSGHFKVASYINNPANTLTAISDEDNWILNDVFVPFLGWQFSIFDYISGSPFQENGVTITITGGNANHGHNPLPPIPNPHITNYTPFSFVLNTETTNWTITMVTTSLYGAYYLNENWHTETNSGNQIVFNIILGKSRGDVEVPIILSDQDPTLPVELSAFTANINSQGGITIMWVTQSETGVNGFYVNRAMVNDLAIAERISPLIPGSNTSHQQVYVYSDKEVYEPGTYYYWLEIQDIDGVVNYYGSRSVTFGGNGNNGTPDIPLVTGIRSIYPNPFNPSATIMYELEQPANLNIEIYNNRGQMVRSFAMGQKEQGRYKLLWDGTDNSGYSCGTGIYFIKMQVGKETFVKKAALIK